MCRRHREQARSHSCFVLTERSATLPPPVGASLLAMASDQPALNPVARELAPAGLRRSPLAKPKPR
ncbi:hypothetical protein CD58_17405 [Pseudomonas brassicacearum]|nr:hypothetical protein CD58_17405 [Pseudomonas brassicacearum]